MLGRRSRSPLLKVGRLTLLSLLVLGLSSSFVRSQPRELPTDFSAPLPITSPALDFTTPDLLSPPAEVTPDRLVSTPEPRSEPAPATCPVNNSLAADPLNVAGLLSQLTQTVAWVGDPLISMNNLVANFAPPLSAYLNPTVWPTINERAKAARVAVMMYHDILPEKKVFFDVTPAEFEAHLQLIQAKGLTPISLDQLTVHLRTGLPLPERPILLTFDDGYRGHYDYVYPLLKKYGYPAVFSIYTSKVGKAIGRSSVSWEQLKQMAADPLVTIASHSVSHPANLTKLSDGQLTTEIQESKRILESQLGLPIRYFTYPEGHYDARVANLVGSAGYVAALTMNDADERLAGQSESLLAIGRIGQSRLAEMVDRAWGGPDLPRWSAGFNFAAPIVPTQVTIDRVPFVFIAGGKPITIHAKTRAQVPDIIANTAAIAAVDGGFFSLEFLDSNVMIGPVFSQATGKFVPGNASENPRLNRRPLVLISATEVRYIPFNAAQHNTLEGIKAEMPDVTDAFVAAGFLVKGSQPQPASTFGNLKGFDDVRHRAFWGINQLGQPMIGVSKEPIDSVSLGVALVKAGYRDAVMLDSGASTSLAYKNESLVPYTPRPVPHVVALVPTEGGVAADACTTAQR